MIKEFNIGPFNISLYSLCILTGVVLAYIFINKESKKHKISSDFVANLIFWCLIFGILGARIYYVVFNLDYYLDYPGEIPMIWNGGLAIHGGIIAGFITLAIYCKKKKVNTLKMLDISFPYVMLAQAIGRWGNFFNQEAHGGVVSREFLKNLHLPKFIIEGMHIGSSYYHPTFLYESFFCLLGFIVIVIIRRNKNVKLGTSTSLYLIWYGIIRFFIESLRTDSLMLGGIKVAQLVSLFMIIGGIILLVFSLKKRIKYNKN